MLWKEKIIGFIEIEIIRNIIVIVIRRDDLELKSK